MILAFCKPSDDSGLGALSMEVYSPWKSISHEPLRLFGFLTVGDSPGG